MPVALPVTNPSLLSDHELLRKVLQRSKKAVVHSDTQAVRALSATAMLDDRQRIFVHRFIETRNAVGAARDAGYPNPETQAMRIIKRKVVRVAIAQFLDDEAAANSMTSEGILRTYARVMRTGTVQQQLVAAARAHQLILARDRAPKAPIPGAPVPGTLLRGPAAAHHRALGPSPYTDLEETVRTHAARMDAPTRAAWITQLEQDEAQISRAKALLRGG